MVLVCMWSGMRTKSCNVKTPRLRWSDSLCCSSSTRSQVYLTAFATNINSWMISVRRSSIGIILFVKMLSERELSPLPFSTPSSSSLIVRRATASSPGFPDLKKSACRLLRRGNTGHTNIEPNPSHNSSHCTNTFQLRVQHYGTRSCVQRHQSWLMKVDTYLPRERPRARGTQNAKV
jgi:hypothetical protein